MSIESAGRVRRIDRALQAWRNGPDHPFKLRLHRHAVRMLRGNLALTSTPFGQFIVDQTDYIGGELIIKKTYEPATISLCRKLLQQGGVFFDVGANLGLYTVAMSAHKNVVVHAFEPDVTNFCFLMRNIRLNARTNVYSYNFALSSRNGLMGLHLPCENNRGSVRVANGCKQADAVVATSTVSDVVNHSAITAIDLIKIDVEGHELDVLRGAVLSGSLAPRNIIIEHWGSSDKGSQQSIEDTELFDLLARHGYRCRTVHGQDINRQIDLPEGNAWFSRNDASANPDACETSPPA